MAYMKRRSGPQPGTAFRDTAFRETAFRDTAFRETAFRDTAFRERTKKAAVRKKRVPHPAIKELMNENSSEIPKKKPRAPRKKKEGSPGTNK